MRAALRTDRGTATAVLHQRAVRLMASNGEAGRAFFFARLYYQLDRRVFTAEDRGQHPDGRPFSLRKRRLSIRGRGTFRPIGSI